MKMDSVVVKRNLVATVSNETATASGAIAMAVSNATMVVSNVEKAASEKAEISNETTVTSEADSVGKIMEIGSTTSDFHRKSEVAPQISSEKKAHENSTASKSGPPNSSSKSYGQGKWCRFAVSVPHLVGCELGDEIAK